MSTTIPSNVSSRVSQPATGPRTAAGKAIASRNATSHGLFARDVVLPVLGEDPDAYNELYLTLCQQIAPRNLIERHYVEKIAAASWRLRRLHRWQAQLYEDDTLTEDQRLDKMDKVLRHETTLHRQIDQSMRLLNRDVAQFFDRRAHDEALADLEATDADCKADVTLAAEVERRAQENRQAAPFDSDFDQSRLDNIHTPPAPPTPLSGGEEPEVGAESHICENELPNPIDWDLDVSYVHPDGRPVYLKPDLWQIIERMRANGEHEQANRHDSHYRSLHLFYQAYPRDPAHPWSKP